MKLVKTDTAEVVVRAVTEFSHEVAEKLILCAGECPSMVRVAAECGVPYRTLRYWLQEGRTGSIRYEFFAAEFDRARATHEDRYLKQMEAIAAQTDNPKALASAQRANEFLLKKLFPGGYGDELYVSTMIQRQVGEYDLKVLPTEVLREFGKILKVIRASNDGEDEDAVKRLVDKINVGKNDGHKPSASE